MNKYLTTIAALLFLIGWTGGQPSSSRRDSRGATEQTCGLNGTYRVDPGSSDRLYSVVRDATSSVPFGDQQQFFLDLTTRLTPPDMLAIECRGQYVTIGSSRANRITYLADGKNRRERSASGGFVTSNVKLDGGSLTFLSSGRVQDNVNVVFESVSGQRMRVTRRIYAQQLTDPIVIQTFYDRLATAVDWRLYDGDLVAGNTARDRGARARPDTRSEPARVNELRSDFAAWLDATNKKDIDAQMRYYSPQMRAYYLTRNTPQRTVRLEKERVFRAARSVDIRAGQPEIIFQDNGRVAVMRFLKEYTIGQRSGTKRGAVIQELRWQFTAGGWKIFSERDVRVIR